MATFHARSSFLAVISQEDSREMIAKAAPEILTSPFASSDTDFPLARILTVILDPDDPRIGTLLDDLYELEDRSSQPADPDPIRPRDDYEASDVLRGSAAVSVPTNARTHQMAEIVLTGPTHGNPFVDVELTARLAQGDRTLELGGFYDGDGRYVVRFLPPAPGEWTVRTTSNARSLDGASAVLHVTESQDHGPVRASGLHFAHADETPFLPLGTTAYAWTHQEAALQEETLRSLARSPFNKLRMALFPKHFLYNSNEPASFVFPATDQGWDTTRFELEYFRALENRIAQLAELGIQADLILFHPYDRWGFSNLGRTADDRYVQYVVRRLAAFPNVWWSLANEYDILLDKDVDDWNRLGELVRSNDHVGHPLSIHNWVDVWDYASPWATHCSIQSGEQLGALVRQSRRRWGKPVIIDECGYEGDLDQGWGSLTAEEEVRRFWDTAMGGGYATHGETFYSDDEVVFWAKGGTLRGESPARVDFLRSIIAESPTGRLEPLPSEFDAAHAGADRQYELIYFGAGRPGFRTVNVPAGLRARIDVIDTWNMSVEPLEGEHAGSVRVPLPARPYAAVRLQYMK